MSKDIRRIIQESRELLRDATPQQKLRLLKLLKMSVTELAEQKNVHVIKTPENADYLEEK